jgi:hypothetical protein
MNELDFLTELDHCYLTQIIMVRSNLYSQADIKDFLKSDTNRFKK